MSASEKHGSAKGNARTGQGGTKSVHGAVGKGKKRGGSGPLIFFATLFILALGAIQLIATFHSYALNLSELNGLKRQEASLVAQKQNLENDISRWNDKAYVTAQARDRLGFVFPGEQAIRVEHPEAVTGVKPDSKHKGDASVADGDQKPLPWYSELAYSFKKADKPVSKSAPAPSADATGGQQKDRTDQNPTDQ